MGTSSFCRQKAFFIPFISMMMMLMGIINPFSASSASNNGMVMARTIPASALDQLDYYYFPDRNLVMAKKSATALNKLMLALRSYEKNSPEKGNVGKAVGADVGKAGSGSNLDTFNMQRRNQKERKVYLRCYFNAVSCF